MIFWVLALTKTVFKKTFFLILFIVLLGNEAFCAVKKSKKKTKNTEQQTEAQQEQRNQENDEYIDINNDEVIDNQAIKLPVQKRTFFYKIDEQIVKEVENGSPESLKNAMQLIKKFFSIQKLSLYGRNLTTFLFVVIFYYTKL